MILFAMGLTAQDCTNNNTPAITFNHASCGGPIYGTVGEDTTIQVIVTDGNLDIVTLSSNSIPASVTVTPALPYTGQTPYTVSMTWSPTVAEYLSTHVIQWLVVDGCTGRTCDLRLSCYCSFLSLTCPPTVTQQANLPGCTAAVNFQAVADGLPVPTLDYSIPSGSVFNAGTTPVTVSASNTCRTISCSFDVVVNPPPPPVVTCPADITVSPTGSGCSAVVTFQEYATSDVGIQSISSVPPSGSSFGNGTTAVTTTATDGCGTTDSCSFNVSVNSSLSVDAGPNASTVFGYSTTQTVNRTATISGGTTPYTISWTLSRPLKCNQVNSNGDELFSSPGGSCSNNTCPTSGSATSQAPSCTGSNSISATLLDQADACITVTDAKGCVATSCFHIDAVDGRCFTGNAGRNKTKICHRTGSTVNPWVVICISKSNVNAYLANHPNDILGPCPSARVSNPVETDAETMVVFPNPFSSQSTIRFQSMEDVFATLEVFSSIGEKVTSLFSGNIAAEESKEVLFDAAGLANGIYICKLTLGNEVYYTKMICSEVVR